MLHAVFIGKRILTKPHKHAEDISRFDYSRQLKSFFRDFFRFAEALRFEQPQTVDEDEDRQTPLIITLANGDASNLNAGVSASLPRFYWFADALLGKTSNVKFIRYQSILY